MTQINKLISKLESKPNEFLWSDMEKILKHFEFIEKKRGKTGGSRRKFYNDNISFSIHKPHPKPILKPYQIQDILDTLKNGGYL